MNLTIAIFLLLLRQQQERPEFFRLFSLLLKAAMKNCDDQIHSFLSVVQIHGEFLYYHHQCVLYKLIEKLELMFCEQFA